jgi:hypothetical protein
MPKWPVGLVQRLLPRKTEIVEQMPVIGEIAQGRALPVTSGATIRSTARSIPAMSRIDDCRLLGDVDLRRDNRRCRRALTWNGSRPHDLQWLVIR